MIEEIWKDIEDFEGLYQISNLGRVKALAKIVNYIDGRNRHYDEKILKPRMNKGYGGVHLHSPEKSTEMSVHRLVCIAFIPNPENKPCINHLDSDRNNNVVTNLEWATYKENTQHAIKVKRLHPNAPEIDDALRNEIINLYFNEKMSGTAIAKKFNIKHGMVYNIIYSLKSREQRNRPKKYFKHIKS